MKKIIILTFLIFTISISYATQRNSFEMGKISITGSLSKDKSNISKDIYSVDALFESSQIKDSLIDSALTVRDLGSTDSLLTVTLGGAKSPQTAKMFDGVILNSPANGDFDISWIEKEMLSSIKLEYSPFFLNSSTGGSGGLIDFSGINHTEDIAGISFGNEKYKKQYIRTMISGTTSLFVSNKEYRGDSFFRRGRQNTLYLKNNTRRFKSSLWLSERTQYLEGSSVFPTPGNYNDSDLMVYNIRSFKKDHPDYGISFVKENNSLYDKALDIKSPTKTNRYNFFVNTRIEDIDVKLNIEQFDGKSDQFEDTDFDGVWDTKRGYNKKQELYSISLRNEIKGSIILSGKFYKVEKENNQELTLLKEMEDSKIIIGNRYNLPTFNDLYWPSGAFTRGNPDLKSESSVFLEYQKRFDSLSISISYNSYKDLIEWMPDNLGVWRPVNLNKAKIGALCARYNIDNTLSLDISRKYAKDDNGNHLIYRPVMRSVLRMQKDEVDILLNYTGKRFINGSWWGGHSTVDINWSNERFYLTVKNLFDRHYITTLNYPEAKRTVFFGVRTKI